MGSRNQSQAGRGSAPKGAKKGSGASFSGLFEVIASGKESEELMDEPVKVRVHVGEGLGRAHVLAVRDALRARRPGGAVEVLGLDAPAASSAPPDAVLILAGGQEPGAGPLSRWYAASGVPCAFLAESTVDVSPDEGVDVVSASEADDVPARLGAWLARAVEPKVALAANFPFCRPAVCLQLMVQAGLENALIGAIPLMPGTDLALMGANQAKLALRLAAAHGEGMGPARALDVCACGLAAFAYRGASRSLCALLPGLGWAVKPAVGFAGTMVSGRAVEARLDGTLSPEALARALGRLFARAGEGGEPERAGASALLAPAAAS